MINKNRLLDLFARLVAIDNPSYGEREIGDAVIGVLRSIGINAYEDGTAEKIGGNCGNLYAYVDGDIDLPPILFSAHLDAVEPSIGKKMEIDENGVITSGGNTVLAADDCAGLSAIIEALTVIKEKGLPHRPIEILFSVAEEPYCAGIRHFDFPRLASKEAYVFDLSGPVGRAAYQAPTIIAFTAEFFGQAAHAGFSPEDGIHAIKVAADAITRIPCGRVGEATVNIGSIKGGTATNIVPDQCRFEGEIRSLSDSEAHKQLDMISNIINESAGRFGARAVLNSTVNCTAYRTEPEHSAARRFKSVCGELGLSGDLCTTFGGSDNNYLALYGIKGIVAATAMNNCHSLTEYTTVSELENAAKLALGLMLAKE